MLLEKRIPLMYFLKKIRWDIPIVLSFSIGIHILSLYLKHLDIVFPIFISTFFGSAIAFLLTFKLNQSYDRWWEARKIWGSIVNDSRSLVMQIKNFTPENASICKQIAYRQMGWNYSLAKHLRKQNSLEGLSNYISEEEFMQIKKHDNIPVALLEKHVQDISELHQRGSINNYQQIQLDSTIVRLTESMGRAERIKNTVFPKAYNITLHVFIYIFLISLSFALTELHSLVEIPLLVFISVPFFLLEKVALGVQNPFENKPADTPMTAISEAIEINLKQLLGENIETKKEENSNYYVL